ncbi:hypothetical protein LINPERHAP1_LOCUS17808 [Linum perenne]
MSPLPIFNALAAYDLRSRQRIFLSLLPDGTEGESLDSSSTAQITAIHDGEMVVSLSQIEMLEKIGEVRKVNFFIADTAEGFFIKGLVKLDLLGSRAGRITARFPDGRSFFVYFQYIQIQAICYQCGIIGHIYDFCPHQHLILYLEARNKWMCIPDCGKLVEGPNLQKKATNKYQIRRGALFLPPSVTASFAAARSNPPSPGQDKSFLKAQRKEDSQTLPRLIGPWNL